MAPGRGVSLLVTTLLLVSLVVLGAGVPVAGAPVDADRERPSGADAPPTGGTGTNAATASTSRTIELVQALHLTPDTPGEIAVTLRYSIPPGVVDLRARVPPDATVTSASGFVRSENAEYVWDRRTDAPSLVYRLPVNETVEGTGPIAGTGDYAFVDAGPWALVRVPRVATDWSFTGGATAELSRTTRAERGAVGDRIAFLGEHREVTGTAHGQTFRLIVPDRADLAEPPARILDALATASNDLQVGDRDEHVFAVAVPTRSVRWGVRGLQTGDSDLWVRDRERLDTADNVWIHEYVHTRQGYATAPEVQWFTEASASYYAALLALEQGLTDFPAFRNRLALGTRTPDRNAVLADPASWNTVAPYTKGTLVAGELDRRIRGSTDRRRALHDVFRRMNDHGGAVTGPAFRGMVREAGGETATALAERYVTTAETPSPWNRTAHDRTFGTAPARMNYSLPGPSGYRVSGPFRKGTPGTARPIELAVGETLTLDVVVSNTGGTAGEYEPRLRVAGEPGAARTGTLEPGESIMLTFDRRFETPGEYTLTVGGERLAVSVREPASPTVTDVSVERTAREGTGRAVAVVVTVGNEHRFPAAADLVLVHDGDPVETRRVELAPGEERTVRYEPRLVTTGTHVFRVADRTVTVTVAPTPAPTLEPTSTPDPRPTGVDGGGFGVVPALVALAVPVALLARRR